ncbi:Transcription factor Adf-1 [Cyphomyrmex costatus]|uniref:Transcription factor Adf-1 n=1 Tax=Cyphomyrmex costatus TaxID=456900 RepID=A0A151I886_9HYME|nr:Transcription factor Adf-1 [Cyphomyrmex costatus]
MESVTFDEVIINFVRDNKCLYDKKDINFKNNIKKKELWHKISESLKNLYSVDMAAEVIEKRWTSLRDMFSREKRKQQLPPSGSGYKPTKEWELYKTMLFLNTYIEHRRLVIPLMTFNFLFNPFAADDKDLCHLGLFSDCGKNANLCHGMN